MFRSWRIIAVAGFGPGLPLTKRVGNNDLLAMRLAITAR
jgi:hypothetical protein